MMKLPPPDSPIWSLLQLTVFLVLMAIMLTFAKSWRDGDEIRDLLVALVGFGAIEVGRRRGGHGSSGSE
jgi:hypothetical protein